MNTILCKELNIDIDNIKCQYIKKIFNESNMISNIDMLSIQDFIRKSEFPIDNFMVDKFFNNLNDEIPIYITNELIEWCGFNSQDFRHQKRDFNRLLDSFEENKDYWVYSNKDYIQFYKDSNYKHIYPHPDQFIGKNKTKHLILSIDCFKIILLRLNTSKSNIIKQQYIQIEKLFHIYMKYQCLIKNISYENEINKLKSIDHIKKYSQLNRIKELEYKLYIRHKVGVIYFICEKDNIDIVKIGYTYKLLDRLNQLQTAHYKELIIKHYYYVQYPDKEETRLHNLYKSKLIRGEWYHL